MLIKVEKVQADKPRKRKKIIVIIVKINTNHVYLLVIKKASQKTYILCNFNHKNINLKTDIKETFDQVTGLNTDSGKMFRLYNASFKRLPDPDGLRYWIANFSSGKDDERAVASSFLASAEFKQRYGENVSNESYVNTLYNNVLGRDYDQSGYMYWLGQLNSGAETRYELLLGFSESIENKGLFSEITGLV